MNFAKSTPSTIKPRVAISACLCGRKVRYDGNHKLATTNIPRELLDKINWIEICPEVYMGLSVPRPAMNLYNFNSQLLSLKEVESLKDHTPKAIEKFDQLISDIQPIEAWVLKERSPSCGYLTTPVYTDLDNKEFKIKNGLFVECILKHLPNSKIFTEKIFESENSFEEFLGKIK
ncbi:MAG: DUF523 domain-containing protein [Bdellovibrionales bacterium]|nr:DUF523 domain-containing protein [Bdellovibrionales bacterium]